MTDRYTSWKTASGGYYPDATPFGEDLAPKPAADALYAVLAAAPDKPLVTSNPDPAGPEPDLCPASPTIEAACSCKGRTATIAGGPGPDRLRGTSGADVIAGLGGRDKLKGRGGNDLICGGAGADRLIGGPGADTLVGGPGRDREIQ
jgi:hypothetical protein